MPGFTNQYGIGVLYLLIALDEYGMQIRKQVSQVNTCEENTDYSITPFNIKGHMICCMYQS